MAKNRDVRNLLWVLGSAMACAFLLAWAFLAHYGPSGKYLAGHVLLDPAIFKQINYQEKDPATGQNVHFLFDRIEFTAYDDKAKKIIKNEIAVEAYQRFYTLIATDMSVPGDEKIFASTHLSSLTVRMKALNGTAGESMKVFQVVQFVPGDLFRVQLHVGKDQGDWVYFSHTKIYQDVLNLFAPQSSKKS